MTKKKAPDNSNPLPKFVGYAEVEQAIGVSRSTIERMVREGTFPSPIQLSANRVGWRLETVLAWLAEREKGLAAKAVTNPEDLSPDQLGDAAHEYAARAFSKQLGEPVSTEQISIQLERPMTEAEAKAYRDKAIDAFENRFAHFTVERSILVVAWLFPALRPHFMRGIGEGIRRLFESPEKLRGIGHRWLHDDQWADYEAAFPDHPCSNDEM